MRWLTFWKKQTAPIEHHIQADIDNATRDVNRALSKASSSDQQPKILVSGHLSPVYDFDPNLQSMPSMPKAGKVSLSLGLHLDMPEGALPGEAVEAFAEQLQKMLIETKTPEGKPLMPHMRGHHWQMHVTPSEDSAHVFDIELTHSDIITVYAMMTGLSHSNKPSKPVDFGLPSERQGRLALAVLGNMAQHPDLLQSCVDGALDAARQTDQAAEILSADEARNLHRARLSEEPKNTKNDRGPGR